jgi:hypothetical protein
VDERVSIGLFIGNETTCKFHYSAEKLTAIKGLFSDSAFGMLKTGLKSLQKLSLECETDLLGTYRGASALKEQYFNYLSRYSNNLITYSAPKGIDIEINQETFNKLFEKFVYHLPTPVEPKLKPVEKAKERLTNSLAGKVNFNADLNNTMVPGLIVPAKVWFIGKNEVQVTGEAKDFTSLKPHIIQQQINAHLFLVDKIKDTPIGKHGKFFLVGDEPGKGYAENHKLWEAVKNSATLDLVPSSEIERIEIYMMEHGVAPLF